MASFNKVILMGNLTRDPDVRATGASGMKVARLGVAVNERRRDRSGQFVDYPVFVDIDAWDKLAELCGQYLTKGSSILVEEVFRVQILAVNDRREVRIAQERTERAEIQARKDAAAAAALAAKTEA